MGHGSGSGAMRAATVVVAAWAYGVIPAMASRDLRTFCIPKWCPETCQYYDCQWNQCMCTNSWYKIGPDKKCVLKCPVDQKPVSLTGGGYKCVCKDSTKVIDASGICVCPSPPSPPPPTLSPPPPACVVTPCPDPATQSFNVAKCKCQCIDPLYKLNSKGDKCVLKCPVDQKPNSHGKCVCIVAGQYIGPSGTCVYPPPPPVCVKKPCPDPRTQHYDCKWGMCTCNDHLYKINSSGKCVPKCPDDQVPVPLKAMTFTCNCKLAGQTIDPSTGKCVAPSPPPLPPSPPPPSPPPPSPPPPPQCINDGGRCSTDSDCCSFDRCGKHLKCKCKFFWSSYKTCEESFWIIG